MNRNNKTLEEVIEYGVQYVKCYMSQQWNMMIMLHVVTVQSVQILQKAK